MELIFFFNDVQPENIQLLIFVNDDGSSISQRDVQLRNVPSPIDSIDDENTTFDNDLQFKKALFPIFLNVGKNVTSSN